MRGAISAWIGEWRSCRIASVGHPETVSGQDDLIRKVSQGSVRLSILKVSIRQIKAARALLGWSQDDLATRSGISLPTIKRLEAADGETGGRAETGESLVAALQEAGVEFIPENGGGGAGVRLAKRQRRPR
jgi:DNA-binding XRE family transcriptional regulator